MKASNEVVFIICLHPEVRPFQKGEHLCPVSNMDHILERLKNIIPKEEWLAGGGVDMAHHIDNIVSVCGRN
jgi:hypothetical protein